MPADVQNNLRQKCNGASTVSIFLQCGPLAEKDGLESGRSARHFVDENGARKQGIPLVVYQDNEVSGTEIGELYPANPNTHPGWSPGPFY